MQKISSAFSLPLYTVAQTRHIEQQAAAALSPHQLMQRAGLSVARLTLALAPHARCIWIACGPGNNGGDGFEAALNLHRWGKTVVVTWTGVPLDKSDISHPAIDAYASRQRAIAAGVNISGEPPHDFDFCIDALLGIGGVMTSRRSEMNCIQLWLEVMHASRAPRLAVDIASGLNDDTGQSTFLSTTTKTTTKRDRIHHPKSLFTLSLLTLKPGLFMAQGRDCSGEIWFDDLEVDASTLQTPDTWLLGADRASPQPKIEAAHAAHKGTFGDVAIVGGESTRDSDMSGAALLAARAALHAGAGRVFVALLNDAISEALSDALGDALNDASRAAGYTNLRHDPQQPELMFRHPAALDLKHQVVVCGCGGGEAVKKILPHVLTLATRLVLDADALNAIATDPELQTLLQARNARGSNNNSNSNSNSNSTVLTPHPLEAARLLGFTTAQVQSNRLKAAHTLADKYQCVVVLKGSGTVISATHQTSYVNYTGNALLATPGTGDVLAGMVGTYWAKGLDGFNAACEAVFTHGHRADVWAVSRPDQVLTAGLLATFSDTALPTI